MLLVFAAFIVFVVFGLRSTRALGITALDLDWIVCTVALIFVPELPSSPGKVAVLIVKLMGMMIDGGFAAVISRMAEVAQGRPLPEVSPMLSPAFC